MTFSTLIMAADSWEPKEVTTAVCLDLEELVHPNKKAAARDTVREYLNTGAGGQAGVQVRINRSPELIEDDLDAVIWPGLTGVFVPKVEAAGDIRDLGGKISALEKDRGIQAGTVKIRVLLDTWAGNWHAYDIVRASPRVNALCLGVGDLTADPATVQAEKYLYLWERSVIIARAAGVEPLGVAGLRLSQAYQDEVSWQRGSRLGYQLGFAGVVTVHAGAVRAINEAYS